MSHEFMSEADSDTDMRLFGTSDTDSDTGSDMHKSDNLGHEFGLGLAFGQAFRHDASSEFRKFYCF